LQLLSDLLAMDLQKPAGEQHLQQKYSTTVAKLSRQQLFEIAGINSTYAEMILTHDTALRILGQEGVFSLAERDESIAHLIAWGRFWSRGTDSQQIMSRSKIAKSDNEPKQIFDSKGAKADSMLVAKVLQQQEERAQAPSSINTFTPSSSTSS
jgi:hypothetical protein